MVPEKPRSAIQKSREELQSEVEELSRRLEETEQVLEAIKTGAIDAVVVSTAAGEKIYTLQGAEHSYRVLVETMNEGALAVDVEGAILYCNKRFAAMLDTPLEKITGSSLASYLSPEEHALFAARLQSCLHGFEKQEVSLITRKGEHLPVLISCCEGEFAGSRAVSIIVTDISSRKQAERTILRLNRLYAVLSATNHAIVHASDRLAIFQELCRVAVELGGFRLAWVGLVEKGSEEVKIAAASGEVCYLEEVRLAGGSGIPLLEPIMLSISNGTHYICNDFEKEELTRPGRDKPHAHGLFSLATIAIQQDAEVLGALTLYADEKDFFDAQQVELLQQMESELSFALDKLHQSKLRQDAEQALQDETWERLRAVEELRKNEQMLIHQSRQAALGEMIGNIAHQWRQPLNSLGLLVQQVPLYYPLGAVNQEYLEKTANKAMELIEHMSRTIDDFRNFFKPNKEKSLFDVKEEVARTLSLMEGSFQGQDIETVVDITGEAVVEGYANEFSQVLLNILINARDALVERRVEDGRVVIRVGREKGRVVVTIADNAGGIPEEIMAKIFDPYFTTKGPQSGTGVGLFMAKTIIERNMGGLLSVRNTAVGAEFRIEV
jgi:PAS domain S-box-containing protein